MISIIKLDNKINQSTFIDVLSKIRNKQDNIYYDKLYMYANNYFLYYNEKIIGVCSGYMNNIEDKIAFISYIGLFEAYQHKGYGQLLIDNFIYEAEKVGMNKVRLEVNKQNSNAIKFYQKNGFLYESDNERSLFLVKTIK